MMGMKSIYLLLLLSVSAQAESSYTSQRQVFNVQENYAASPWYFAKVQLPAGRHYDTVLAGDPEGIIHFDPETRILSTNHSFDREKQESYTLQVMVRDTEGAVTDTITVHINVNDVNDNPPVMVNKTFHGKVSKGSRAGVAFVHVVATDKDDPKTDNAALRYSILSYHSALYEDAFQIEPRTGAVSLTEHGAAMLSELKETNFKLLVQVKDMGDQSMGFTDKADLEIDVTENTWIDPGPVYLPENLKGDYPLIISQVKWDSTEVHYTLEGDFKEGLFTVAETGNIFITRELDRETQSQYRIKVSPVNNNNIPYSDSLEITLTVQDENDNKPVFSHQTYRVEITDKASKGSVLLTLSAVDADDKDTNNADIRYRIVSQEPSTSEDTFHLDDESGVLTLQGGVLGPGMAKTYTLEITATDRAGAQDGLSSSCRVTLDVMDLNDNPPVFLQNQFPPFVIAEDTAPGLLITTLTATDGDDLTDYKLINFSVQSGNEDGTFSTVIDQEHSTITIYLNKDLDYEKKQKYELILLAKNEAELRGAEYGPSSTATVHVAVGNVNEAPVFTKEVYEIHVPESTEPGAVILTVEAFDPDIYHGAKLHYSIHNDTRRWLSIQDQSGKIQLRRALDREEMEEATYTVQVIVTEEGIGGLSDTANVVMHVLDVNDNIPFLVGDYSRKFFCSHRVETQRILIRAYDHDVGQNGAPFTFQAVNELHRQPKWKVDALNGTHAYLSMAISYLEPKVHDVPIILSDHGKPAQSQHVLLPVTVCLCGSSNHCITEINRMESMPTVSTAMGTLLGTLGVIVLIMIVIFTRLSIFTSNKNAGTPEAIPLKNTV